MLADDRAQRLYDQQFTGTYDSTRIIEGVSDGEQAVVRIMKAVSRNYIALYKQIMFFILT
jgi:hypothetical protein